MSLTLISFLFSCEEKGYRIYNFEIKHGTKKEVKWQRNIDLSKPKIRIVGQIGGNLDLEIGLPVNNDCCLDNIKLNSGVVDTVFFTKYEIYSFEMLAKYNAESMKFGRLKVSVASRGDYVDW